MSQIEKILIPLIDDNILYKDINNTDFVGVFTEDINAPSSNYVYIVFTYNMMDLHPSLGISGIDNIRQIGKELFQIYKFPRTSDINKILSGNYTDISNEGITKIFSFWNDIDKVTSNYPFHRTLAKQKYYRIIPEEEFIPLCKKKKPQGITVEKR